VVIKNIGFLSFGTGALRRVRDSFGVGRLLQSIDLAIAAEELVPTARISGFITSPTRFRRRSRCFRHWCKTSRIEIGTAGIDMRYENPLYMAEDAGSAD